MGDDWGWYFTSAERRTSLLRDELDAVRSSASAQTSRLTSQLRTLQGSIETRLTALSAAFDAYVELGDIREQLAGYPDTTVVRRDVMLAVEALAGGRQAERIDDRGEAYWLAPATNAVIGLVQHGAADEDAEQTARALSPDAELFVVAACGALGRGSLVADRLPPLLVCDGALNDDQVALWEAAVAGCFGWVLPAIGEVWASVLDGPSADVASWREWCHQRAGARDVEATIGWIAELFGGVQLATATSDLAATAWSAPPVRPDTGPVSEEAWSPGQPLPAQLSADATSPGSASGTARTPGPEAALRTVVTRLVAKGTDQEAPLLERARELRRRIEHPGSTVPADAEPIRKPVVDAVRSAVVRTARTSPERTELLTWVGPALRSVAEAEAATLSSLEPVRERVRTVDLDIFVTAEGAETGQVDRARAGIAARYPESTSASAIAGGVAALFGIASVIAIILGSGWAFLTAIVAVAAGVVAVRAERARRERRTSARAARDRLTDDVAEAEQVAAARIDAREITRTRVTQLLEFVRSTASTASTASTGTTGSTASIESGASAQP